MNITCRRAKITDLAVVIEFVDYWLSGRGKKDGVAGVADDYFITHKQQYDYLCRYIVLLAFDGEKLVGWCVKNSNRVMIALLVAGPYRGIGIGRNLLCRINPEVIRSKVDQSTGNPAEFYNRCGYVSASGQRIGKNKNIELFVKSNTIANI